MRRIDGDEHVAFQFGAVARELKRVREALKHDSPQASIIAMEAAVIADLVLGRALCDLEAITGIPWTAIPEKPDIGRDEAA